MWVIGLGLYLAWVCFLIGAICAYAHGLVKDLLRLSSKSRLTGIGVILMDIILTWLAISVVAVTIKVGYQIILKLHF